MSFSKKTLLAAALFIGGAGLASADDTIVMTSSVAGNITITDNTTIYVEGGSAYTLNGLLVSESGNSFADGYTDSDTGDAVDAVTSAAEAEAWYSDPEKSWLTSLTVTITGGGTFSIAGSDGSGYYSSSYTQVRGNSLTGDTRDEVLSAWDSVDSFWNNSVYYGSIVVDTGTTLHVSGDAQLVQYVSLYIGNARTSSTAASPALSYYIGVSSITLEAGATLSFEEAGLNLREDLSDVTSEYVTALQIIQNLYADATSRLVIGTDTASSNRIVLYTGSDYATNYGSDTDEGGGGDAGDDTGEDTTGTTVTYDTSAVSTVGRLVGNGRFYTFGNGAVAFIGESELNPGTNNDTSGHTWISGNLLADIILENSEVYVGANPIVSSTEFLSDSEALAAAVDNVFAGATAVHIGTAGGNTNYTIITSGSDEVEIGAAYVGSAAGDTAVTVYGNQTFNNFQSLWIERSNLLSDSDLTTSTLLESEPVKTSYYSSSLSKVVFDMGSGTTVRVAGGSVLTIDQDEYCDGWYAGTLVTHLYETESEGATSGTESIVESIQDNGDGLVVKTGAGKIYYNSGSSTSTLTGYLSKLRIEEGAWVTTVQAITGTDIELSGTGELEILVGSSTGKVEMTATVRSTSADAQLVFSTFTVLQNDLTSASLEEADGTDDLSELDLEYREYTVNLGRSYSAAIQVVTEQSQFYGTVVVNDGLTLILGDSDSGESSPSIFSSAAGIVLNGANEDDERYEDWSDEEIQRLAVSTLSIVSGNQLVSNLSGEAGHSAVEISSGATLVLTSTADSDASYYGTFSGNGNLIRFGGGRSDSGTTVSDTVNVSDSDLFGSLFVMSGSATVTTTSANAGFAGLVLANKASVEYTASDGAVKVGALVGESGTTLAFSGTLTVGDMSLSTGLRTGGSYLATANYSAYSDYFSGTTVESVLSVLTTNATNARGTTSGNSATYESTLTYLANPADLVYQASTNADASASDYSDYVLDGSFARVYATTGTDHSGNDVFAQMKAGEYGSDVFGSSTSVSAWLRSVFTVEAVEEFIDSESAQLSSETATSLVELATAISGSASGVYAYLDSDGNLAVAGWNEIVAAGGLSYLKYAFSELEDLADDTLYSFITFFYEDYEFTLTQDNATLIASDYNLSSSTWITTSASSATGYVANYAAFIESFGVESTEFAGKLTGSGDLIKAGAETLALTGHNTYTGKTYVQAGELYVKWYAVQYTSGIDLAANTLLTIDANTTDETGEYDTSGDDDVALTLGDDYGEFFSTTSARITGSGIVLKTGDGAVDLGNAVLDNSDGEFTGTFLVADGELKATVSAEERAAELDDDSEVAALNFGIEFSTDSGSDDEGRIFRLEFAGLEGTASVELELAGNGSIAVTGEGTFILDAGTTDEGERNVLSVDLANTFNPTNVSVESGALKLIVSSDDAQATGRPDVIALAAGTQLIFDLEYGVTEVEYEDMTITGENANVVLTVSADADDGFDTEQRAIVLSNSVISGVTALELTGLAKLSLTTDTETTKTLLSVTSLTGDEATELSLGGGYRIAVDIDYSEDDDGNEIKSVFAGLLSSVSQEYTAERTITDYDDTMIAAIDYDDDGVITENDVGTVVAAVYDTDGDGVLDKVTVTTVAYFTGTLQVDYDVNGDGVIDRNDTVTVTLEVASDVNDDGVITADDATLPETVTVTDSDGNEVEGVAVESTALTLTSTEVVTTVSWTDVGDGTLVKDGTGTLVIGNTTAASDETTTTAFSGTIVFAQGTLELLAGENVTLDYSGATIVGEDDITQGSSNDTRTLVKDGAGTILLLSDGENYIDVDNLEIVVNDGELWVGEALFTTDGQLPASIEIAESAAFRLVEMETDISVEDLAVSGTGTLEFSSAYTTTVETEDEDGNPTTSTSTDYNEVTVSVTSNNLTESFTGTVSISQGVTLELGEKVTKFSGISGEGTVRVGNSDGALTLTVDGNADGAEVFAGTFENLKSLTVVGEGAFAVASSSVEELGEITVGSATQNGGVGITADWEGTINVLGATSRILVYSTDTASTLAGDAVIASSVDALILSYDSEIALGDKAVATTFNLQDSDGETLVLDGTISVTLSNIANSDLTLTNLNNLDSEVFSLSTNDGGVIIFSGTSTTTEDDDDDSGISVSAIAIAASTDESATDETDTSSGTWDGDITGTGGITVTNGASLTLTSSTLSYTGATTVEAGSTLTYAAAGTVSASSGLYVESGSTVVGGVSLTGEETTVVFEAGSTFVYTGSAIEFTGSAEVSGTGTITVVLDSSSLSVRGQAVSLFNYIGEDEASGTNGITLDKITFDTTDGVGWYRDGQDDDAAAETGSTTIYLVADDLASVVSLHDGLSSSFVNALNALTKTDATTGELSGDLTDEQEALAVAIIKTSNGAISGVLNNLSPLSYGAMLALPQAGFLSDIAAISSRLEARRYDSYSTYVWDTHNDWEFFAQAQGTYTDADNDSDTRTFDMDIYGIIAGADVKLSQSSVAGFAIAYDYGKADIHDSGGKIESNDIRATAFFGRTFDARFYLDAGAQIGWAAFDVKRDTVLGSADGDTTGLHAGVFATLGALLPMYQSEDEKTTLSLMPFVGLSMSYYSVDSFDESGTAGLDTDSFDAGSIRATIGASVAWVFPWLDNTTRLNLDFSYTRELLDNDVDIDYEMPDLLSGKFSASAIAFAEDTFSIGPRVSYDLDRDTSIYAGYRFEVTSDSDTAHSVNLGFRTRF